MNIGSGRLFMLSSRWLAAFCDSRSNTFCDKHVQRAVAQPAERGRRRRQAHAARRGVTAADHQRRRGVGQHRRPGLAIAQQERQDPEEARVDDDRVELCLRHQLRQRTRLVRHRLHEQPDDVEVDPLDARGVGAAGQVDVEAGHVEVGLGRYRPRGGADGADLGGVIGRGQDGDAVAAVDQTLRDVQQGTDVADRRQRGDEDFWHAIDARPAPAPKLGGFVEIRWRSQAACATAEAYLADRKPFP